MRGFAPNDRLAAAPRETGRAVFPHPAFPPCHPRSPRHNVARRRQAVDSRRDLRPSSPVQRLDCFCGSLQLSRLMWFIHHDGLAVQFLGCCSPPRLAATQFPRFSRANSQFSPGGTPTHVGTGFTGARNGVNPAGAFRSTGEAAHCPPQMQRRASCCDNGCSGCYLRNFTNFAIAPSGGSTKSICTGRTIIFLSRPGRGRRM